VSSAERDESTARRIEAAVIRTQTAAARFDWADRRDEISRLRDLAARARDHASDARDRLVVQDEPGPAAAVRAQAAADRARASADRERAAVDRAQAAIDRRQARAALLYAHDELTGAFRPGMGNHKLQSDIDRAWRTGGRLVLAFVDVDGLKELDDRDGDALLIHVASTIRSKLGSNDTVVRFGGDEFVCSLSGADLDNARRRFDEIQGALGQKRHPCSISVGFARLQVGDTVDDLIARGDAALYQAKRCRWLATHRD
jgi:diguanylate cyclase (GGDEF)-like protein